MPASLYAGMICLIYLTCAFIVVSHDAATEEGAHPLPGNPPELPPPPSVPTLEPDEYADPPPLLPPQLPLSCPTLRTELSSCWRGISAWSAMEELCQYFESPSTLLPALHMHLETHTAVTISALAISSVQLRG